MANTDVAVKTLFALEMPVKIGENYPDVLRKFWGEDVIFDPLKFFEKIEKTASECGAGYVSVYFNIENTDEIENCKKIMQGIVNVAKIPLIIKGTGQKSLDEKLLPELLPFLKNKSIIASAQDLNYKTIVKAALDTEHILVMRTPIDINLTKELNILSTDLGLEKDRILIDPDMGCVGYGLDYGYSIIERIKLACKDGDEMLDMPVIVFSGEESFKAKESKSDDFGASWGELETRSIAWEVATTTALICAGAYIAVVWHPKTIETLRGALC